MMELHGRTDIKELLWNWIVTKAHLVGFNFNSCIAAHTINNVTFIYFYIIKFIYIYIYIYIHTHTHTGLLKMIVRVLTTRLATSFSRCNPMWFLSMGLCQGSGLCSSSSHKCPGTEDMNQNSHWNHHRSHAADSLEWTRLSCWCL